MLFRSIMQVARSAQAAATVLWGVAALGAAVAIGGLAVGRGKRGAS